MDRYTKDGYRVIALATKTMPKYTHTESLKIERTRVECDLTFLGLLIMANQLKPQTKGVISNLNECNVRTVMATGDNVLTAISVARQCNILDSQQEVWLGDLAHVPGGPQYVEWKSTMPNVDDADEDADTP